MLWETQQRAPECLPVYYLLYKTHATRREFGEAERAALLGLAAAARQANLPAVAPFQVPSGLVSDFASNGPARFWLFTLKALAFIRLRRGDPEAARELLETIQHLDPDHSVGSDVTLALLDGVER